ncbi:ABC transporter permease subunit [Actinokineospora bangkokensis]|uniref:ABC transporter permease n=1 Tax=Actinokineospora bangkokensis TaxID=1193682 RepID=A0A1Q9LR56_9PSEU|nr:ABC transporter permease subunit [Actinokineospora bangkokensis]OLR94537.1 hypothetical protein BJP25_12415 [Actinokineospora bangkokensis]
MTWLAWRQVRLPALLLAVLIVLGAIAMLLVGRPPGGTSFGEREDVATLLYGGAIGAAYGLPALLGAFLGAPVVTRELEAGTHRLAWTQGISRTRWLLTRTAVAGAVVLASSGLVALLVTWWAARRDHASADFRSSLVNPDVFGARGLVPVGTAVFALALGVAVGAVVRRTLPAVAVTLALVAAVQLAMPLVIREHLWPPVEQDVAFSAESLRSVLGDSDVGGIAELRVAIPAQDAWVVGNDTLDRNGDVVAPPAFLTECFTGYAPGSSGPEKPVAECMARLDAEGYRQHVEYQPTSHFWPLQIVETLLLLVTAGALTWFSAWWVRTRLT